MAQPMLRETARSAWRFALPFVGIGFVNAAWAVVRGGAPPVYLVIVPLLTLALYFGGAVALQVTGAVTPDPSNHLQLDVNPWFAWLVGGGLVCFFVGLMVRGHNVVADDPVQVGGLAALAWIGLVALVWVANRILSSRGA